MGILYLAELYYIFFAIASTSNVKQLQGRH